MDLDATLKRIHARIESIEKLVDPKVVSRLLELADASGEAVDVTDLKAHLSELAETVAGLQQAMEKVASIATDSLKDALAPLDAKLAAVEKLADPAVIDLLDWLARNREPIAALLTLGDEDKPADAPGTSEPATAQTEQAPS